jgi:hypothetical protein
LISFKLPPFKHHDNEEIIGKYKLERYANMHLWTYQRWDQVYRRSKHPL